MRTGPVGIFLSEVKPDGVGTYVAVVPGLGNPELVKLTRRSGAYRLEGANWVMALESVGDGWLFSQRLDIVLSPAGRAVVEPEKEPTE